MGCLNSTGKFEHWFGNIHLSGPCNRACYFCIGQHMMELDALNTLDTWPLPGMNEFIERIKARNITEVNLTGTNTDPLLFNHHAKLYHTLRKAGVTAIGIRTNGISSLENLYYYDMISLSVTSLDPAIYRKTMMQGSPPNLREVRSRATTTDLRINCVLCPENEGEDNLNDLIWSAEEAGFLKVNLREPYGQPHRGNPIKDRQPDGEIYGQPYYMFGQVQVVYWDVHYVHVESVNLYANGRVSEDYPITRGHSDKGLVMSQDQWTKSGRHQQQWIKVKTV